VNAPDLSKLSKEHIYESGFKAWLAAHKRALGWRAVALVSMAGNVVQWLASTVR
jgi:hypothetical protein